MYSSEVVDIFRDSDETAVSFKEISFSSFGRYAFYAICVRPF